MKPTLKWVMVMGTRLYFTDKMLKYSIKGNKEKSTCSVYRKTLIVAISAKGSGVNLTCPKIKPLNH